MSEGNRNLLARQYKGQLPTEPQYGGDLQVLKVPNLEYERSHPRSPSEPMPDLPDEQMDVAFVLRGGIVYPSALDPNPSHWKGAIIPVAVIHRMPFLIFKAAVDAAIASGGQPPADEAH